MPRGAGRPPKAQATKSAESKRVLDWVDLGAEPVPGAPKLPEGSWSKETRRWFESWRRAPQASMFAGTDWQALMKLAYIVEAFYQDPTTARHAEIRVTESRLGATVSDRLQMRWRIETRGTKRQEPEPPEGDVPDERPAQVSKGDPRLKLAG